MSDYAELQVTTNFSFLRGASHAHELIPCAAELGLKAIAITDRNTLAGVVRMHSAIKALMDTMPGIMPPQLIIGCRLDLEDGPSFLCYPIDRPAYGRLCQLLTLGKRRAKKGECQLYLDDLLDEDGVFQAGAGQIMAVIPPTNIDDGFRDAVLKARKNIKKRLYLIVNFLYFGDDKKRLADLASFALQHRLRLLASNDVHAHVSERRPLQDILTCIRKGCTIKEAGLRLHANAERHLKGPKEMARLFAAYPQAIANTLKIAETCTFSLEELKYEYPVDPVPVGRTPQEELERLTWEGAAWRYPAGVPAEVTTQLNKELQLIAELKYAPYFLTIRDIVQFAEKREILCQGRGSAANSSVCFVLGITAVDPTKTKLLFERFISLARNEPPDIDVDFEHERREEVIQYIYEKYGRAHAGLTATVITYRTKSAVRDVGKAMGLSEDSIQAIQSSAWGGYWDWKDSLEGEKKNYRPLIDAGVDPFDPLIQQVLWLVSELRGFPRHLSQHTGGFVITKSPLSSVVPIENAAMDDRTVIEWDKDDLDAVRMLKIDVLALGMLTCIRKAFALLRDIGGPALTLATVPSEDPKTYDMLCEADSIGVFQVESRAQMNMLPRLQPRKFYDLIIEVAIVRPGPIQGDMVHPYLRRRQKKECIEYPSKELEDILERTLGVPLFQEQAMSIAITGAGFTPSEADNLRRSMASFRRNGQIKKFEAKFISGMIRKGYERSFAARCFEQIKGFGEYGFPESHAASFANLVYVSAWLKCHYPAVFATALLNSQPMGFYAPAQIIRDARQHGVEVRAVDVNSSEWDCTLEKAEQKGGSPDLPFIGNPAWRAPADREKALRLGFRQVKGISEKAGQALSSKRGAGYRHMSEIAIPAAVLEKLARADAFAGLKLDRRQALWAIKGLGDPTPLPLFDGISAAALRIEPEVELPALTLGEQVADDYRALRMSLKAHPMKLLRESFAGDGTLCCSALVTAPNGSHVRTAGLVLMRQRPGEGNAIFITLEDETGVANVIVWKSLFEELRSPLLGSRLMAVTGKLQREGSVTHIVCERLYNLNDRLDLLTPEANVRTGNGRLLPASRDFR